MLHEKRISKLTACIQPIALMDSVAEAGRKAMVAHCIHMLEHEEGSRYDHDIEDIHQMRVATRRMRSAFRLLKPYYTASIVTSYTSALKQTASLLGDVRDIDVILQAIVRQPLMGNNGNYGESAENPLIDRLDKERLKARVALVEWLDSKAYRQFVKSFTRFLRTPDMGTTPAAEDTTPYQVRHVVPVLLHRYLAAVRAFDVIDNPDAETLHRLRIRFKRLRYATELFSDVLGPSIDRFVDVLKVIQDHLGTLQDIVMARYYLENLSKLKKPQIEARDAFFAYLDRREIELLAQWTAIWSQFNAPETLRVFSDALLVLR